MTYERQLVAIVLGLLPVTGVIALAAPPDATKIVCHETADFVAIVRERNEEPGESILVRKRPATKAPCTWLPVASDFVAVPPDAPRYFLAFSDKYLALDVGTGSDRTLMIYDVTSRKALVDTAYDSAAGSKQPAGLGVTETGFTFWRIGARTKASACPAAWRKAKDNKGLKFAHSTAETRLAFADGNVVATGKLGCVATQDDLS